MAETTADNEDQFARANEKSRKRKAARDKILATKTLEKGLLMVHTGKGKGKSTAAFGLVARAIGNGMRVGVVQYVKGKWQTGERGVLEKFADQHKLTHRFAIQKDRSVSDFYGVRGIPHAVLIDRNGKVALMRVGSGEDNAKAISEKLEELIAAKP